MTILKIDPGKSPIPLEIENSLESMQSLVGGLIQAVFPFPEPVALICNDEGKLLNLPFNRALRDESGNIYDLICGTFFLCGAPADSDDFTSLTEVQLTHYTEYFRHPECLIHTGKGMAIVQL